MAVGIEYLSQFGALPTGVNMAEAFQRGQKAAADIAATQQTQGLNEQIARFREMQQPYQMAALQRGEEQAAEEWRRNQEQYGRTQQALGMPLVTPGMRTPSAAQGAGLRPTVEAPTTAGVTPTVPTTPAAIPPAGDMTFGLVRGFEGFRETPYYDVNAYRVGFGSDTVTLADGSVVRVQPGMKIAQADAERDLARRINTEFVPRAAQAVGTDVWASLPENIRAPLTSLTYNYGQLPDVVANATKTGDPNRIAQAIESLAGQNQGVNYGRRMQEAALVRGTGAFPTGQAFGLGGPQMPGGQFGISGAAPTMAGAPLSTGMTMSPAGVPMTGETGSVLTGLPLSERPIASALSSIFGGTRPPAPPTTVGLAAPGTAAGAPEIAPTMPTAPTTVAPTGSIFQQPGVQTGTPQAVGEVNTFELLEPVRIAQSMDNARRKADYLKNSYERARLTGNIGAMDKIQAEAVTLRSEGELLGRMDALTQFNDGNITPMAGVLSSMTKGRMAIEPRTDGKFNIYDGKRKTAEGLTREELSTQFRMAFDQDFQRKIEAQRQAQLEYQKELGKAGLDILKETKKQSVQQIRELTNKLAELQFKRDNPRVRLEKTEEGFIEYDDVGNIRSFVTTQPEIGIDGKPVFVNPSDPKSGPRYRVIRTPYTGAVPTQ